MKDLRWQTLAQKYLLRDTWATVRADRCKIPDGRIVDPYYVYEFPTWVTALAVTEDGLVIMERQYRHALDITAMEIPGGCVDPEDENFEAAAKRELIEETGYTFSKWTYLGKTSANPSTNNNWMHMFLAEGGVKTHEQHFDPNEQIEVELVSIGQLHRLLAENAICQSMHVTAIYYGLRALGKLA